ncbi:MAG: hypothetical protein AUJ96_31175 [Armatimonadetes bacterium CG2_30_66_41]|nr:fumarylacetoacetate hydrolase family protein [Armatimonadota bacterium]NCO95020.1 fumarylacetoacetate hydrolase family protein [Armatimonadota bacterium]NCP29279.1 fumarylacetoacetate hydrolase family protein [Armatimonadota bacterium]NDK11353.1 fumarylacetoacetate hydrolase family protein [Armatimonadota bacterium]OIO93018.1 MAG: hypothetical protein AUJ96_31175 [Armatimonadetes bacterium CG2_30_66_41]
MRLATFTHDGRTRTGLVAGDRVVDLNAASGGAVPTCMRRLLREGLCAFGDLSALAEKTCCSLALADVKLEAPIPNPANLVCLGLNYEDHAAETNTKLPEKPLLFGKATSSITGPYDPVVYNPLVERMDYEVELALVIGKTAKAVAAADAYDYIVGYTCFQDISARCCQFGDGQWFRGKSFDTFGPMGPWLVTKDEIADVHNLNISCAINGEVRQSSNTKHLHAKVPDTVAYVSSFMTLQPGDVISTGTPSGCGEFVDPKRLLSVGDVIETRVELIGELRNEVVAG